jgi:preprotein translocase subunit SecG
VSWLTSILIVLQVLCAIVIIVLVLLQHGKGADMGAAFGGGASGSLFGATGSANFLSRTTGVMAAVFFAATLALAWTSNHLRAARAPGGGLMRTIDAPADKGAPVPVEKGAAVPADKGAAAPTEKGAPAPAGNGAAAPTSGGAEPAKAPVTGEKPADIPK